jgi:hypothetical protein
MDFFKLQRDIEAAAKAAPAILAQMQEFQAELRAHRAEMREYDSHLVKALNALEAVSQRQTEIELQLLGLKGATQR